MTTFKVVPFILVAPRSPPHLLAQRVEVSSTVSAGTIFPAMTASAAVRADLSVGRWGVYGRAARRGLTQCLTSLPPYCDYPTASPREYAFGLTYSGPLSGRWRARASAGLGILAWDGEDRFLELGASAERRLFHGVAWVVGMR